MRFRLGENYIIENPSEWFEVLWFPPVKRENLERCITWRNKTEILACLKTTWNFVEAVRRQFKIERKKYSNQTYEELVSTLPKYDEATDQTVQALAKIMLTSKLELSRRWIKTFLIAAIYNMLIVPLDPVEVTTTEQISKNYSTENFDNQVASYHHKNFQNNLPALVVFDKVNIDDIIYWLEQNRDLFKDFNKSLGLKNLKIKTTYRIIFLGKLIYRIKKERKLSWNQMEGYCISNFNKLPGIETAKLIDTELNSEIRLDKVLSEGNLKQCYKRFLNEVIEVSKSDR